ncbi:odorant receptor 46a-like isoform X2 [Microplitis mediator]|uniref:odorant receptor 46a-like isoform X2 n=1 Tax=Microplitis mediator TaxID=375433 RepID=UPI0025575697|nr:odorant receptor 46a-like isoform X2 [Microplitis mediator]
MNVFEQPYYKLLINFARSIGRWPDQSRLQALLIGIGIVTLFIVQVTPIILSDIVHSDDRHLIFETLAPAITYLACFELYLNTLINGRKLRLLFERINDNWKVLKNRDEKHIMEKHTNFGNFLSAGYAVFVYIAAITFVTEPVLPMMANYFFKTNISAPHNFAVPMEWIIIDTEKYYWVIMIQSGICTVLSLSVLVSVDVIIITLVYHACGLFAVAGHRIESLPYEEKLKNGLTKSKLLRNSYDVHYIHLVSCIRFHRRALEYFDLIESAFCGCFGAAIGLNLPIMSITGVQFITQSNTLRQKIKMLMFAVGVMIHLFFECFISQQLTDMSLRIQQHIANTKWYDISVKSQKLLVLMTRRCQIPCILTAGKIVGLSMESFGMMIKTSASYFTFLLSMQ